MVMVWPEYLIHSVYKLAEGGTMEFFTRFQGDGYYSEVVVWENAGDESCHVFSKDEEIPTSWIDALVHHGEMVLGVLSTAGYTD